VTPTDEQIRNAPQHIAWEYVALLAAALPPAKPHETPVNHQVQESFLLHVRNLAEFFYKGVADFRKNPTALPSRPKDNIYAVDLCSKIEWDERPFDPGTKLRRALDKTLSHLTYSRDLRSGSSEIDVAFDGPTHVHGTVRLMRRTWDEFMSSLRPEYEPAVRFWLQKQADGLRLSLSDFDQKFDNSARLWQWHLSETPDGRI
jgi:hypothetical protein